MPWCNEGSCEEDSVRTPTLTPRTAVKIGPTKHHLENFAIHTELGRRTHRTSFRFVIFKNNSPQMTMIRITCSLKLLNISQNEVGVGMAIKSVICLTTLEGKSHLSSLSSLLRLLQNRLQLQFHFFRGPSRAHTQNSVWGGWRYCSFTEFL